jgi:hypothetical protein
MFGRKKIRPAPVQFGVDPKPSYSGPAGASIQAVDGAIAALSEAVGLDLDFGRAYIFAPSHWEIPKLGAMLTTAGIEPNMAGNTLQLLKSPASVMKLSRLPEEDALRSTLEQCGFGLMLYDPDAENGFSDGLAKMQADALKGFASEYPSAEARHYAVFDLHK